MEEKQTTVLVTGSAGMIGSAVTAGLLRAGCRVVGLDRRAGEEAEGLVSVVADLGDATALERVFADYPIDRVIHLAALAHTAGEKDLSWERYEHINVTCAENVFSAAVKRNIPVLFISTADVYGFVKGTVNGESGIYPVTNYGKSKAEAEKRLKALCEGKEQAYTIFRFAPVYTETLRRDIQKRYYLRYPRGAYLVGKGTEYEVLSIENAVAAMAGWLKETPRNDVRNIKNPVRMNTADLIAAEKAAGRASFVWHFPRWAVKAGVTLLRVLTGKNKYTYLLNKVVNPLRTE